MIVNVAQSSISNEPQINYQTSVFNGMIYELIKLKKFNENKK